VFKEQIWYGTIMYGRAYSVHHYVQYQIELMGDIAALSLEITHVRESLYCSSRQFYVLSWCVAGTGTDIAFRDAVRYNFPESKVDENS